MIKKISFIVFIIFFIIHKTDAQTEVIEDDDILKMLDSTIASIPTIEYTQATFKGTRIISGQSIENPGKGTLQFTISHRFGALNSGAYNFFGLDEAAIRLGLEYGITNRIGIGIGRSSIKKTYDGFLKYKLVRQSTGLKKIPLSITLFGSTTAYSLKENSTNIDFTHRLVYTLQTLIARKFNERLSIQLSPTFIHRNLTNTKDDPNNVWAVGIAARHKLSKRISLNVEYFYILPSYTANHYSNCLSIGFDIETGGHVFQLHVSNSQAMTENYFIAENTGKWKNGDIYFGFNISRVFNFKKSKKY